ncbi:MAG: UDP-N-acetylmuramate dehydrogenase [Planctomycetota bacterium]|nr:UDP-N-acetylmuramate dehydrogenase [Planctomycetota bacterium]
MSCETNWPCVALEHVNLADRNTMRVGGQARWLLEPTTPEELREAYLAARERDLPIRYLGGGANIIPADGVWEGVVICTTQMRRIFRPLPGTENDSPLEEDEPDARTAMPPVEQDPRLIAWAGTTLPALMRAARDLGLSGLEGLAGVPGQVGGGIAMNAGGTWGDLWDHAEYVQVINHGGEFQTLTREEANPTYRNGGVHGSLVVGAVWRLEPRPRLVVQEQIAEYLRHKRDVQPVTESSAGCIFKNPDKEKSEGRSAGALVDQMGLKGLTIGAAQVSQKHANFIINNGGATASDVYQLMDEVRDRVAQKSGVELEFEVKRWLV